MSGLYPQVAELEAQNAALGGKAGGYSDERGPLVAEARLQVASDDGRCAGELHKKGGTRSGLLNRHNWSLRTFWVRTELADGENYELLYFKGSPDYAKGAAALRKAAKGSLPLAGCTVVEASTGHRSKGVGFEFQLFGARSGAFEMYAETLEARSRWCETLRYVISVANARARWLQGERSASLGLAAQLGGLEAEPSTAALAGAVKVKAKKDKAGTLFAGKKTNYSAAATTFQPEADPRDDSDDDDYAAGAAPAAAALGDGATCALRVEVDADAYPPQSAARAEFLDAFARDVAEALDDAAFSYEGEAEPLRVAPADVRVLGLAPAPELDWMCLVEFELFPGGGGDEKAYEAADRAATRGAAARKLAALVKDADSPLYEGDVACFVDRDFTAGLFGVEEAAPAKAEAPLSPDPAVAAVLARYDAARAPPSLDGAR